MGGRCKGELIVAKFFDENQFPDCMKCGLYDITTASCQVLDGIERTWECPELQDYLNYHEVPVPKKLKRKSWG